MGIFNRKKEPPRVIRVKNNVLKILSEKYFTYPPKYNTNTGELIPKKNYDIYVFFYEDTGNPSIRVDLIYTNGDKIKLTNPDGKDNKKYWLSLEQIQSGKMIWD